MDSKSTKRIVFTGLFAGLIFVSIRFFYIPVGNGLIQVGDSIIYMGAIILPFPFGILSGAIGASLSDMLSPFAIYAVPTLIIKSINAMCFYIPFKHRSKIITVRTIVAVIFSSLVTVVGYFFAEWILFGKAAAFVTIPRSFIQAGGSFVVFVFLGLAFDKVGLLKRIKL